MRTLSWFLLLGGVALGAEPKMLVGWEFSKDGDLAGWTHNGHVADVKVAGGALSCRVTNWDPIFISPTFDLPARHSQWIEAKLRASEAGDAEFFWSGTLTGQYGGFAPGKETGFKLIGDGAWHVYRVHPFWEPERKIVHLRFDLPGGKGRYEVESMRILEGPEPPAAAETAWDFAQGDLGWRLDGGGAPEVKGALCLHPGPTPPRLISPPLDFAARERFFAVIQMKASAGTAATLGFANGSEPGLRRRSFALRADNEWHSYLIDLSAEPHWRDTIRVLTLDPTDAPEAEVAIREIRVARSPEGPGELILGGFGLGEGLPRAGQRLTLTATLTNVGASPVRNARATFQLDSSGTALAPLEVGDIWPGETRLLECPVEFKEPFRGAATLHVQANGVGPQDATARLEVGPGLGLPKADYVPEPRPAKSDYQVGAYYFPGWKSWASWRPIADYPERKPILGWYDESKPEIADWQIKWAVEHGISFFAVDWYWSQGARQLEHWLNDAYFKSRYRHFLKFCLLWANHNPPKTSSEADLLAVTDFWLANYFRQPEYLTVEGKPVVIIFSTHRFTQDMGSPAVAAAFAKMRERCRAAGLPGLYLIACAGGDRGSLERLKAEGYDAVSGYNYPSLGSDHRRWFPYADNIEGYKKLWHDAAETGVLPEIPVLSGGWDSRPWHGQSALVVAGRTPALFERHCRDAKEFLDSNSRATVGLPDRASGPLPEEKTRLDKPAVAQERPRICLIEAWNEWGEGSYIGPHREFGFGYLEAVRRVFAPDSPKPPEVTPRDVGLGPYDLPRPDPNAPAKTAWDFSKPEDRADWNLGNQIARDPAAPLLKGTSTGNDPIIQGPVVRIPAERLTELIVEMRLSQPDSVQLFWHTTTGGMCENNSVHFDVPGDGQFHEHRVDLRRTPYWTGLITGLRLDPANKPGVVFEIRSLRFAAKP